LSRRLFHPFFRFVEEGRRKLHSRDVVAAFIIEIPSVQSLRCSLSHFSNLIHQTSASRRAWCAPSLEWGGKSLRRKIVFRAKLLAKNFYYFSHRLIRSVEESFSKRRKSQASEEEENNFPRSFSLLLRLRWLPKWKRISHAAFAAEKPPRMDKWRIPLSRRRANEERRAEREQNSWGI
jgi:hypothetical protein